MRFAVVILSALLCLNARAEGAGRAETSDEDIVAAAEKLVNEAKENAGTEAKDSAKTEATLNTATAGAAAAATTTAATQVPTAEAIGNETKKESEIPVFTKSDKVAKSESSLIWRLIGSLAFIAAIGGALIYTGKRWKRDKNRGGEKSRIEVLHQYHLGPKKSLALIRVAGEAMLIGCTDQSVNMIKPITLLDEELTGVFGNKDFNGFLEDEFTIEDMRTALQPRA